MGLLIKVEVTELKKADNTIAVISSVAQSLALIEKSPQLPLILGRAAQRRIDRKGYEDYSDKYKLIRAKANKGTDEVTLKFTGGMYERLKAGQGFALSLAEGGKRINVSLSDPIARGHQGGLYKGGKVRPVIEADEELARDLANLANDVIGEELKRRLKK